MLVSNREGIARQAFRAIWNDTKSSPAESPFAQNFAYRNSSGEHEVAELEDLQRRAVAVRAARPCSRLDVSEVVGAGEHLAVWWVFRDDGCVDTGDHFSPHRPVVLEGNCMLRLHGGRVIELWELGGELMMDLPQ